MPEGDERDASSSSGLNESRILHAQASGDRLPSDLTEDDGNLKCVPFGSRPESELVDQDQRESPKNVQKFQSDKISH